MPKHAIYYIRYRLSAPANLIVSSVRCNPSSTTSKGLPDAVHFCLFPVGMQPVAWQRTVRVRLWPGYMTEKKFESLERINSICETNRSFDACNWCKTAGTKPLSWVKRVKTSACFTYRIHPFQSFDFFRSCIRSVSGVNGARPVPTRPASPHPACIFNGCLLPVSFGRLPLYSFSLRHPLQAATEPAR